MISLANASHSSESSIPLHHKLSQWSQIWRAHGRLDANQMAGESTAGEVTVPVLRFNALRDLLPSSEEPAITDAMGERASMTFQALRRCGFGGRPVVTAGVPPGWRGSAGGGGGGGTWLLGEWGAGGVGGHVDHSLGGVETGVGR